MSDPSDPLPQNVLEAIRRGNLVEAIKLVREQTGLGLKEAHDAVEAAASRMAIDTGAPSPGEVPRRPLVHWLIAAAIVAAVVVYVVVLRPA